MQANSVYEAIGGMDTFEKLVGGFYAQVRTDDVIGPMYPDQDWDCLLYTSPSPRD